MNPPTQYTGIQYSNFTLEQPSFPLLIFPLPEPQPSRPLVFPLPQQRLNRPLIFPLPVEGQLPCNTSPFPLRSGLNLPPHTPPFQTGGAKLPTIHTISAEEIRLVDEHLNRPEFGPPNPENDAMLQRLKDGYWTEWDQRFFEHEFLEANSMNAGVEYEVAHRSVLKSQGLNRDDPSYPAYLYHPDVVLELADYFNRATLKLAKLFRDQ
jgi:hypothetical protein